MAWRSHQPLMPLASPQVHGAEGFFLVLGKPDSTGRVSVLGGAAVTGLADGGDFADAIAARAANEMMTSITAAIVGATPAGRTARFSTKRDCRRRSALWLGSPLPWWQLQMLTFPSCWAHRVPKHAGVSRRSAGRCR